jgi:putative protease
MVEIMAPAGSFESLHAAIKAGADSVYFGIKQLNMRSKAANNFQLKDLKKISEIAKKHKIKTYLTVNTVMYDNDLQLLNNILDAAKENKITAIIASDIAAIQLARNKNIEVHISTQANVSNIEAVKFFANFADVIVLARELRLSQIKKITAAIKKEKIKGPKGKLIQIELFVHGALCVAVSGKCFMSLATYNHSANRGMCLQNCRRSYKVTDTETGDELILDNEYVMSPKDLCTISVLDKLIHAGTEIFKLEGRGRSPEYVYTVTKVYKEAAKAIQNKTYTKKKIDNWIKELETVFNRGFWHGGYYLGNKMGEWSEAYGSKATERKVYLGKALNYYTKAKIAHFQLETKGTKVGDNIIISGPTTGIIKATIKEMRVDEKKASTAKKGQEITLPIKELVRKNDKLFKIIKAKDAPITALQ